MAAILDDPALGGAGIVDYSKFPSVAGTYVMSAQMITQLEAVCITLLWSGCVSAVLYFVIVVPYKTLMARRGETVFGEPAPVKTCPACLSDDLPVAASKCKYCGTDQPATAAA